MPTSNPDMIYELQILQEDNRLEPLHYGIIELIIRDVKKQPPYKKLEAMHGIARSLENDLHKLKEGKL